MTECIQVRVSYLSEWATYEHLHAIACNLDVSAYAAHALELLGFAKWERHQNGEVLRLTEQGTILHTAMQTVTRSAAVMQPEPAEKFDAKWERLSTDSYVLTYTSVHMGRSKSDAGTFRAYDAMGRSYGTGRTRVECAANAERTLVNWDHFKDKKVDRSALVADDERDGR